MGDPAKCRDIVVDESLEGQLLTLDADVSLRKEMPGGFWLQASDESGNVLVWSKDRLEGKFELYGRVYKGYLILKGFDEKKKFSACTVPEIFKEKCPLKVVPEGTVNGEVRTEPTAQPIPAASKAAGPGPAPEEHILFPEEENPALQFPKPKTAVPNALSAEPEENPFETEPFIDLGPNSKKSLPFPTETLAESKSHLVSLGVVCISSLALGAGAYALSLTYPPQMQSSIFLMLPLLSVFLGLAVYFAIVALDERFIRTFGFGGHAGFLDRIWHIFVPYILSAFILLFASPEYVQQSMTLPYLFGLQKAFMFALIPIGLGVGYHLVMINNEEELDAKQLLAFGVTPAILFIPLFVLYYLVTSTIGA